MPPTPPPAAEPSARPPERNAADATSCRGTSCTTYGTSCRRTHIQRQGFLHGLKHGLPPTPPSAACPHCAMNGQPPTPPPAARLPARPPARSAAEPTSCRTASSTTSCAACRRPHLLPRRPPRPHARPPARNTADPTACRRASCTASCTACRRPYLLPQSLVHDLLHSLPPTPTPAAASPARPHARSAADPSCCRRAYSTASCVACRRPHLLPQSILHNHVHGLPPNPPSAAGPLHDLLHGLPPTQSHTARPPALPPARSAAGPTSCRAVSRTVFYMACRRPHLLSQSLLHVLLHDLPPRSLHRRAPTTLP